VTEAIISEIEKLAPGAFGPPWSMRKAMEK